MKLHPSISTEVQDIIKYTEKVVSKMVGRSITVQIVDPIQVNESIIKVLICAELNVSWNEVLKRNRKQELVLARQLYSYLCDKYIPLKSQTSVGSELCLDRSGVSVNIKKVQDKLDVQDEKITQHLLNIENKLVEL